MKVYGHVCVYVCLILTSSIQKNGSGNDSVQHACNVYICTWGRKSLNAVVFNLKGMPGGICTYRYVWQDTPVALGISHNVISCPINPVSRYVSGVHNGPELRSCTNFATAHTQTHTHTHARMHARTRTHTHRHTDTSEAEPRQNRSRQGPDLHVCSQVSFHTAASLPSGIHTLQCLPCSLLARDTSSYQWLGPPAVTVE